MVLSHAGAMSTTAAPVTSRTKIGPAHVLVPLGAVVAASPWGSPGPALVLGALVGLAFGNPFALTTRKLAHRLLTASVVGLGAAMDLRVVARAGLQGVGYTAASITLALGLGLLLARVLRVELRTGLLISVGTAICGGSAIAAVAPAVRARDHEVTVALATVFLLNACALFAFPLVGHAFGLGERSFGLWAALAIHDTSSVVGAAMSYGARALEVATTVKLARALWIVPVTLVVARTFGRRPAEGEPSGARPARPWFIAGFLLAAAVVTFLPALRPLGQRVGDLARHAMSVTLFLVGAGLTRTALRAVGPRALAHGVALWLVVAAGSLTAVVLGAIR